MTAPTETGRRNAGAALWTPSPEAIEATNLRRYETWLESERGLTFDRYHDLWQWSVDEPEAFWASIWEHFEVSTEPFEGPVLVDSTMPGATWFPRSSLNYAAHFFRNRPDDRLAIIERGEAGGRRTFTWGELRDLTGRIRSGLTAAGIGRGDRVAAYLPNVAEAVAALLATASIGAIWSCVAPEMGAASTVDRFRQIEPKLLLAVDGYRYNGRDFDRRPAVAELAAALPTLEQIVVIDQVAAPADGGAVPGSIAWEDFVAGEPDLEFAPLPFDHPLWILYSSGTTGLPKPIVHGHGGILLEHLKKLHLHVDARPGDRIMWFSTTGWMMWNFLVGALLTDAVVVLYDGSPKWPSMDALWDLVAEERLTCFGTSAGFLTACMTEGVEPTAGRDLSSLRALGSTGSPLSPEAFEWVYEKIGSDVWLFSSSGGTDLCTSFLGGVPTLPVHTGELQARSLGADVAALDPEGRPLIGQVGELAILAPMPSMPIYFWNDPDGERLRDSYFSTYPGIWRHGDWIEITGHDGVIVYGRSDSTINRGGVRMGTSEFYASVLTLDEVADALVVDVVRPDGSSWLPLFVVLADGAELDDDLRRSIAVRLRTDCSPRHVPDDVFAVPEVPRTRTGKPLEVPVKRILMGADVDQVLDREALANPAALDPFLELAKR
jgi:acetoacetyl-CoA synthetase